MNNTKPDIRFGSLNDNWKSMKISQTSETNPRGDVPTEFNYIDLESVKGTEIVGETFYKIHNAPSRAQRVAKKGDVFFQMVRPYQKNNTIFNREGEYVFSTGYAQLRPYINSYYLLSYIQRSSFVNKVLSRCTGTSYPAISANDFFGIQIKIPSAEIEQTQIGIFFKELDELIELQKDTISKLEEMKKGFLRMIFPEYGKKTSKIYFSKKYSQWGIDHLKNLSTEENKGKIQASEISNNKMDRTLYLDANRLNGGKSQYTSHKKDTNINDIIMLWDGSKAGQVFIGFEGILGSTLKRFVINDEYNSNFIYYQLKKHEIRISLNYRTPNIPHVVKDFSSIFKINTLDDFNIQKLIGTFFNSLDCLIELENKELELLQEMKKGFLQKMFV